MALSSFTLPHIAAPPSSQSTSGSSHRPRQTLGPTKPQFPVAPPPPPRPRVTSHPVSAPTDPSLLRSAWGRHRPGHGLLCPAFVIQHRTFRFMNGVAWVAPSMTESQSPAGTGPTVLFHPSVGRHWGCPHLLAIVNDAATNTGAPASESLPSFRALSTRAGNGRVSGNSPSEEPDPALEGLGPGLTHSHQALGGGRPPPRHTHTDLSWVWPPLP